MPYTILLFLSRKPGTTVEQFKQYYSGHHLPLFREMTGSLFPSRHEQRYIHRTESSSPENTQRNPTTPATVIWGTQADFDYDVVVTIEYKDEATFQAHFEIIRQPENAARIAEDEERFIDRSRTRAVVLGDTVVTLP